MKTIIGYILIAPLGIVAIVGLEIVLILMGEAVIDFMFTREWTHEMFVMSAVLAAILFSSMFMLGAMMLGRK